MKLAKILAASAVLVMAGVILYAFVYGDFLQEGRIILSIPWGIVSLVDLYTGFFLFSGWIVYREQSIFRSIVWIILLMLLGFFIGSVYTLLALQMSRGNWKHFWLGKRWKKEYVL